jgi:hypothetical protein
MIPSGIVCRVFYLHSNRPLTVSQTREIYPVLRSHHRDGCIASTYLASPASSLPQQKSGSQLALGAGEKGPAGEAMRGNPTRTAILRVDAGKLTLPTKN